MSIKGIIRNLLLGAALSTFAMNADAATTNTNTQPATPPGGLTIPAWTPNVPKYLLDRTFHLFYFYANGAWQNFNGDWSNYPRINFFNSTDAQGYNVYGWDGVAHFHAAASNGSAANTLTWSTLYPPVEVGSKGTPTTLSALFLAQLPNMTLTGWADKHWIWFASSDYTTVMWCYAWDGQWWWW